MSPNRLIKKKIYLCSNHNPDGMVSLRGSFNKAFLEKQTRFSVNRLFNLPCYVMERESFEDQKCRVNE